MPSCVVKYCPSRSERGVRLFQFPSLLKNAERRKLWEKFVNKRVPFHARICEFHFSDAQFELNRLDNKKKLKWNAIPDVCIFRNDTDEAQNVFFHIKQEDEVPPTILFQQGDVQNFLKIELGEDQPVEELPSITDHSYCDKSNDHYVTISMNQLETELKAANRKIKNLEDKINTLTKHYDEVFNEDQRKVLMSNSGKTHVWSEDTIDKALKLYTTCGANGYEEIRRQKLPYPCIRTLQRRMKELGLNENEIKNN